MQNEKKVWAKLLPYLAFIFLFSIIAFFIYYIMNWVSDQSPAKKKAIQQIMIVTPPPPPPPVVEEMPPPETEELEIEEPEPTPEDIPEMAPDEAPPGEQLGLDIEGTGGGDAFGLLGKKGGRGLLSGRDPYAWYSREVQQTLFEVLNEVHSIRQSSYSIILHIWISKNGLLEKIKLVTGSGNERLDSKIKQALENIDGFEKPVPGMSMPIKVRLTARL